MNADELLDYKVREALGSFPGKASAVIETKRFRISFNGNGLMKSASTIKLAVLLEAFRQIDQNRLRTYDVVKLSPEDFAEGSGVLFHMGSVKRLSIEDLLTLMIIVSDNTASNKAIDLIGIDKVNNLMVELGCAETVLGRKFMDFEAASIGQENYTSSADLVTMLKQADSGVLLSADSRKRILHMLGKQQLLANLHGRINEEDEISIFSKSGSLPGVVNDAGIFVYRGQKVYAAVMLEDCPNNHSGQELIAEIGSNIHDWLKTTESPAD